MAPRIESTDAQEAAEELVRTAGLHGSAKPADQGLLR